MYPMRKGEALPGHMIQAHLKAKQQHKDVTKSLITK